MAIVIYYKNPMQCCTFVVYDIRPFTMLIKISCTQSCSAKQSCFNVYSLGDLHLYVYMKNIVLMSHYLMIQLLVVRRKYGVSPWHTFARHVAILHVINSIYKIDLSLSIKITAMSVK